MRPGEVVSLQRMKAWWTYTEIRSPRLTEEYQVDPRVPPLLAKVGSVAFKSLSALEIDALAEIADQHLCYVLNKTTARAYAFPIFALIGGRIARDCLERVGRTNHSGAFVPVPIQCPRRSSRCSDRRDTGRRWSRLVVGRRFQ